MFGNNSNFLKKGIEGIDLRTINPPYIINNKNKFVSKTLEIIKQNKKIKNKSIKNKKLLFG